MEAPPRTWKWKLIVDEGIFFLREGIKTSCDVLIYQQALSLDKQPWMV